MSVMDKYISDRLEKAIKALDNKRNISGTNKVIKNIDKVDDCQRRCENVIKFPD